MLSPRHRKATTRIKSNINKASIQQKPSLNEKMKLQAGAFQELASLEERAASPGPTMLLERSICFIEKDRGPSPPKLMVHELRAGLHQMAAAALPTPTTPPARATHLLRIWAEKEDGPGSAEPLIELQGGAGGPLRRPGSKWRPSLKRRKPAVSRRNAPRAAANALIHIQ